MPSRPALAGVETRHCGPPEEALSGVRRPGATEMAQRHGDCVVGLWWLPLLAGGLPLLATVIAFNLSASLGLIPSCNPFIDGCTSISRAARHGLPNILFRALVLPAALLQCATWWLCAAWLREQGSPSSRWLRALPWLGAGAALALAVYASFLGTEGEVYRWMRRYGVSFYFGLTCLCMLVAGDAMRRLVTDRQRRRHIDRAVLALCLALPLLGMAHVLLPLITPDEAALDALQNATEWWGGALFTLFFVLLARAWRASAFGAALGSDRGGSTS